MMGGKTPETCWAVNKRHDNKLKNCCIWLVNYLNWDNLVYFSRETRPWLRRLFAICSLQRPTYHLFFAEAHISFLVGPPGNCCRWSSNGASFSSNISVLSCKYYNKQCFHTHVSAVISAIDSVVKRSTALFDFSFTTLSFPFQRISLQSLLFVEVLSL